MVPARTTLQEPEVVGTAMVTVSFLHLTLSD